LTEVTRELTATFDLLPDNAAYDAGAEALYALVFGPGRHAKAAARLREGNSCRRDVSFVAVSDAGELVGACRLWPLVTDQGDKALFLGPIAVAPDQQGQGLGGKLVEACLAASDSLTGLPVILVGDLAFFEPYGFRRVLKGQMILPGPADPNRLLWRPGPGLDVAIPAGKLLIQAVL
jgi:predicted N-acetyltransferase YhbS